MSTIGVRELRQDASRWLREVEAGGTVVVTNRGRPVAKLVPIGQRSGLDALEADGRMSAPVGTLDELLSEATLIEGEPLSPKVLERRDDERY